jgi:hypothetical protein
MLSALAGFMPTHSSHVIMEVATVLDIKVGFMEVVLWKSMVLRVR